ncbi:putative PRP38 pre-mRNA splicing factor family member [Cryptosporidium bovis]|uniref:putative PRP38 pre-mRNA splicing factor family member n=1 Tax=Cryptosporidium bovis TaxID=310047 RepID=UPI00351AAE7D|nr:putative PRP38 pre-mRNA splicing factor family member [Cryptosporidium bovis]
MTHDDNNHALFSVSSIMRDKVFSCFYWKSECFGLDSVTIMDKAVVLDYVGTTYGGERKATPFLCLIVKLLQIKPSIEILREYINNPKFKYLTALGIIYLRLTSSSINVYNLVEHLYQDFRKLKIRNLDGSFGVIYLDEFVEICLCERKFLDLDLPFIHKRSVLVEKGLLTFPRSSELQYHPSDNSSESDDEKSKLSSRSPSPTSSESKHLAEDPIVNPNRIPTYFNGKDVNLSVEQWNIYRKKLGLKPLK